MMPFLDHADIILVDEKKDLWRLDKPLAYTSKAGEIFIVPAGFECDLASIPRLPLTYWLFKGPRTHRPGILHDWLCRTGVVPRKKADDLFYEALRSEGVNALVARTMWLGVRATSATK